jgi:iron complex outermembrane recepter protein
MKSPKTIAVALVGAALCAVAWADERLQRITLNIEPQPISKALMDLGEQAGLQVLVRGEDIESEQMLAPAVNGELTVQAALERILTDSGLTYEFLDEKTVRVLRPKGATTSMAARDGGEMRVAQASTAASDSSRPASEQGSAGKDGESDGSDSDIKLEEVVVTAQKREERLIDVPISIVALNGDELQRRRISSLDELALAVPGLAIQGSGYQRRLQLRGISNAFGKSSLIGLYFDEAPVAIAPERQLELRTYDLERVEVLRGPQGTLYGEGSVGGTIRFITKNPDLDEFGVNADAEASFTEDGNPGQRFDGVLNLPVIAHELGLRVVGTYEHGGGWIDHPEVGREDYNDKDLMNVKVKGLWQPTPQFSANAMAVIHRKESAPTRGEDANGNFSQVLNLTTTPLIRKDDYNLFNLTLAYDFSSFRLLNATSYIQQEKDTRNVGFRIPFPQPPAAPFHVLLDPYMLEADIVTDELRATSTTPGPWEWTAGLFYRNARLEDTYSNYFSLPMPPGTPLPPRFDTHTILRSKSWAVFGDTSYRLTDRLTLGAGLRYFEDDQEFTSPARQTGKFHALNPRLYAQLQLAERVNAYASVAKGFRSGGFNTLNQPTFDPEEVWTYELGTKMLSAGGRLSSDAAIFHSDYRDYQINGVVVLPPPQPPTALLSNAGNAKLRGIEWTLAFRPSEAWTLGLNANYVDSEFYEINATFTSVAVGDPIDLFPEYGYTLSAQRDFSWNGKAGYGRIDYNEQGHATYRNRTAGPWYVSQSDIINMLNVNVGISWSETLSINLFAQNLLNDRGYMDATSIEEGAARSRPRTFGIQFGIAFD